MDVRKALLTAAGAGQRTLPLQTIVAGDGRVRTVLRVLLDEVLEAGIEEVAVVVRPGDEPAFVAAAADAASRLHFVPQPEPLGYAHAVHCATDALGGVPFLHLVGDHLFVRAGASGDARELCGMAQRAAACVSAVQPTREHELVRFGAVGGRRVPGEERLYEVQRVLEKPTPTQAEQELHVPGLRAGHYLCFFGMHVWTPSVMDALDARFRSGDPRAVVLSDVLDEVARRERYLALEMRGRRYDLGDRYGLLAAQLAIGLRGRDRERVLDTVLDVLMQRERTRLEGAEPSGDA
ncbi:MAG: UTP--glucose-1-phosphate uridylyltransferase [Planctomycetes bacterium]|nr:UTP--glucose-1-phosphate uridylyltransferase [Planctomycetota bacterium]